MRRRPFTHAAALLVVSIVLGACGEDSFGGAPPTTTTTVLPGPASTTTVAPHDVEAVPSEGCGTTSLAPGEAKVTTTSGSVERWYLRHLPPAHDGTTPLPLILDFHGFSEGAEVHVAMTGLGVLGDREGFVTVTPQGLGPIARWDVALDSADVAFVGDLLDEVERTSCVDLRRVYAAGLSNGAMLSSSIACAYADRVAAVATVAGLRSIEGCAPSRPVPVVAFHGTRDQIVTYDGRLPFVPLPGPSVPEMTAVWALRNGCVAAPEEVPVAVDVMLLRFDCPVGAEIEFYRIADGGHAWPGSELSAGLEATIGRTTMSIDASELIWHFFAAHPLPSD